MQETATSIVTTNMIAITRALLADAKGKVGEKTGTVLGIIEKEIDQAPLPAPT